jgi:hypothetical protein
MKYATNSEAFRAEARLCRAVGDEALALRWDRQADMEQAWEEGDEFAGEKLSAEMEDRS